MLDFWRAAVGFDLSKVPSALTFDKLQADDSPETVLLEVYSREEYSPEEEAALFQSTIHRVAAHWSEMGGIRIDFCESLSDN